MLQLFRIKGYQLMLKLPLFRRSNSIAHIPVFLPVKRIHGETFSIEKALKLNILEYYSFFLMCFKGG